MNKLQQLQVYVLYFLLHLPSLAIVLQLKLSIGWMLPRRAE